MTEAEWHGSTDPTPMLEFLAGTAGARRLRLFAAACVRMHWGLLVEQASRDAVRLAEEVADGIVPPEALADAYRHAWDVLPRLPDRMAVVSAARAAGRTVQQEPFDAAIWTKNEIVELHAELAMEGVGSEDEEDRLYWEGRTAGACRLARLLRDLFDPFRTVPSLSDAILAWNGGTIRRLAQSIYEEREMPGGTLDAARLAILADALEDAGTTDAGLLAHLRGPGPHVRGCFALGLLLEKG
jgi:hypothetical protein